MDARQFAAGMQTNEEQAVQMGQLRGERRRRARQRLDFAAACGACTCFGEPHCLDCGGEGRPGWQGPDENLFRLYVAPLLERLGVPLHDERAHHALAWASQNTH